MSNTNENLLEKIFNTIKNSNNSFEIKNFATNHLISLLPEYKDYYLYLLINIYELLMSPHKTNRECGIKLISCIKIKYNFIMEESDIDYDDYVYLSTKDYKGIGIVKKKDVEKNIKTKLNLEYTNIGIISKKDLEGDDEKRYKTSTVEDKPIENLKDFYENLLKMTISAEWYKRHGAFGGLLAIVENSHSSEIEIELNLNAIVDRALIILKNDKFSDFVDNKAVAPVREEAVKMVVAFLKKFKNSPEAAKTKKAILDQINSDCWHTQYTILNFIYLSLINNIEIDIDRSLFISFLSSTDEDIKYITADIIILLFDQFDLEQHKEIYKIIINQLNKQTDEEIAHSKSQIIKLLRDLIVYFGNKQIEIEMNLSSITSCYTSTIEEIKDAVIDISLFIDEIDVLYLLAESVLFYGNRNKAADILQIKLEKTAENDFITFCNHFIRQITEDIFISYDKDQFVCYDENYFTRDGWKVLGYGHIMDNRVLLLKNILGRVKNSLKIDNSTVLEDSVNILLNPIESSIFISGQLLKDDFAKYKNLTNISIHDFIAILNDKDKNNYNCIRQGRSIIYFGEYSRLNVIRNIKNSFDFSIYFFFEFSTEFLHLILHFLVQNDILDKTLSSIANKLIYTENKLFMHNCRQTFQFIDEEHFERFINNSVINYSFEHQLILFSYFNSRIFTFNSTQFMFDNCIEFIRNLDISYSSDTNISDHFVYSLNLFIKNNLCNNCKLIKLILKLTNINLFGRLIFNIIDASDYSFNVLLVKHLFKCIDKNTTEILAKVISSLVTGINHNIKNIDEELYKQIEIEYKDIEMLLDSKKIEDYNVDQSIFKDKNFKLREYQLDGIRWINFIFKFNLGGILADDMGLGKTMQILTYIINQNISANLIVICPSSLIEHWYREYDHYFIKNKVNLTVYSFDQIRKSSLTSKYDYLIIDEGHIIRNRKTVLYSKIKEIDAVHKLILTGTPVHNSVDDLYSLFDVVIPGYLGDEKEFSKKYKFKINDKTIEALKNKNETLESKMSELHKKVLPFILRRLKTDVLKDLPPKIIKDVLLKMDAEQKVLYNKIEEDENDDEIKLGDSNAFLKIKNLLKAASHPKHFTTKINLSRKTAAIFDIIEMCGGMNEMRNKMIIFFQSKNTMHFVYDELVDKYTDPSYFRVLSLDSTYNNSNCGIKRDINSISVNFNNSNANILLSTTSVGGLGLNLTSADRVIFYEHDWNPFNDLQAMDRAHRLGQRRVVNVIRLIMEGTIEEKVMNYQNFKKYVSGSIITQQNTKIENMEMKDLLEKF